MAGSHRAGPDPAGTAGSVLLPGTERVADSGTDLLGTDRVEGTDDWWDGMNPAHYHRTY